MTLICPICQSKFSLEEAATTQALHEMIDLAVRLGKIWYLVNEYIEAFRASQYGGITIKKRVRLLREVMQLLETCEFIYDGKRYRTDRAQIRAGLLTVCNMDKFGFLNHNYLKKVLIAGAKRVSASGHTAEEEQNREQERQYSAILRHEQAKGQKGGEGKKARKAEAEDPPMSTAEYQQRLGALADQIGEKCHDKNDERREADL